MSDTDEELHEVEPSGARRVEFADPTTGKVWSMPIITFVVFMTKLAGPDLTSEEVSRASGHMATILSSAGWFTKDEYAEAWAKEDLENVDDELRDMIEGGTP